MATTASDMEVVENEEEAAPLDEMQALYEALEEDVANDLSMVILF